MLVWRWADLHISTAHSLCAQVAFVAGCFYTGVGLLRMGG